MSRTIIHSSVGEIRSVPCIALSSRKRLNMAAPYFFSTRVFSGIKAR